MSRSSKRGEEKPSLDLGITPDLVDAGLVELYAYDPELSDGRETVTRIMKLAVASLAQSRRSST